MKADPKHTTSRRSLLVIGAAAAAAGAGAAAAASFPAGPDIDAELLALWRQWQPLADQAERVCGEINRIFDAMPEGMDLARVEYGRELDGSPEGRPLYAHCDMQIDQIIDHDLARYIDTFNPRGPQAERARVGAERRRAALKRGLAEHRAEVLRAQDSSGLTAAHAQLEAVNARLQTLQDRLLVTHARGPVGAAVKLIVALEWERGDEFIEDYPLTFLVSMAGDMLPHLPTDLAARLRPVAMRTAPRIGECLDLGRGGCRTTGSTPAAEA